MTDRLSIESAPYRLDVHLKRGARWAATVHVKVAVALAWAVPMSFELHLPGDEEALRKMLRSARGGYFVEWLAEHGYDEYGRGKGDWGTIV